MSDTSEVSIPNAIESEMSPTTMEDPHQPPHQPPQSRHRKFITGATADELTRTLESDDPLPDPMPMTVWLRGDESYCGDFSLDAEAVMAHLGIKRTRLTQISGRELRVGRIKKGRYIVPVYRPDDIAEYLSWSRATATHLKSTQVVQDATSDLKEAAGQIFTKMESTLHELSEGLAHDILTRVAGPLSKILVYELKPFTDQNHEKYSLGLRQVYQQVANRSLASSEEIKSLFLRLLDIIQEQTILFEMKEKTLIKQIAQALEDNLHKSLMEFLDNNNRLFEKMSESTLKTHEILSKNLARTEEINLKIALMDEKLQELSTSLRDDHNLENAQHTIRGAKTSSRADLRRIQKSMLASSPKPSRVRCRVAPSRSQRGGLKGPHGH